MKSRCKIEIPKQFPPYRKLEEILKINGTDKERRKGSISKGNDNHSSTAI
jgi:hypothetical protein